MMYLLSAIFSVALKLGLIMAVMIPYAASQTDGNVKCQDIWIGRERVTLTFVLEKIDFKTKCPGGSDNKPVFQRSVDDPSASGVYVTNCTVPDITTSKCDFKPGTEGCGCVKDNGSYVIEYNFLPEMSFDGWWTATVACFGTIGPAALNIGRINCDDLPTKRQCSKLGKPFSEDGLCSKQTEVGFVCTAKCDPGYDLSGNAVRTCQDSGLWNGSDPSCVIKVAVPVVPTCVAMIALAAVLTFCCCCCCVSCRKGCSKCCCHSCKHDVRVYVDPEGTHGEGELLGFTKRLVDLKHEGTVDTELERIRKEEYIFPCCPVKKLSVDGNQSVKSNGEVVKNSPYALHVSVSGINLPNVRKAEKQVQKLINEVNPRAY